MNPKSGLKIALSFKKEPKTCTRSYKTTDYIATYRALFRYSTLSISKVGWYGDGSPPHPLPPLMLLSLMSAPSHSDHRHAPSDQRTWRRHRIRSHLEIDFTISTPHLCVPYLERSNKKSPDYQRCTPALPDPPSSFVVLDRAA